MPLMGPLDKNLAIDTVSQKGLNAIKKTKNWRKFLKIGFRVPRVNTPEGLLPDLKIL